MIFRDLNLQWDEKFEFFVYDFDFMDNKVLEFNIYNDKKIGKRNIFFGKVKMFGFGFVKFGLEILVYYLLEKCSVFLQIKGEIGFKVWYEENLLVVEVEKNMEVMVELVVEEDKKLEEKKIEDNLEEKKKEEEKLLED